MMDWRNVLLLGGLVVSATAPCQEPQAPKVAKEATPPTSAKRTTGQWIEDLGNDSYRVRFDAERALRELGDQALPDLRKAAERSDDSEVQMRAQRLVRQIERGGSGRLTPRSPGGQPSPGGQTPGGQTPGGQTPGGQPLVPQGRQRLQWLDQSGLPDDVRSHFEDLFRHFEDDFGLDVPRGTFFRDDFFQDLQQQFQGLQPQFGGQPFQRSSENGFSMEVRPDGSVHAEVKTKNDKGEVENKVYDAPDMKSFQEQYPDVLGQGGGTQFWFDRNSLPNLPNPIFQMDPRGRRALGRLQPLDDDTSVAHAPVDDQKRLGIMIRPEIAAELREHLELPEGQGLMVESVVSGSLAEQLGLLPRDIVLQVAGKDIGSAQDVQDALGAIPADQEVVVQFLRKGANQTAKAKRPAPAEAEAKAGDAKGTEGGTDAAPKRLERRVRRGDGQTIR